MEFLTLYGIQRFYAVLKRAVLPEFEGFTRHFIHCFTLKICHLNWYRE